MIYEPQNLWNRFLETLENSLKTFDFSEYEHAWLSPSNRTSFYINKLFPKIAKSLGFDLLYEDLRIDVILSIRATSGWDVPVISIESENDSESAEREVWKLCYLNSPLKVLFICTEWSEKRFNELITEHWSYIVNSFKDISLLNGILGIIVAEKTDKLRFYFFAFDDDGKIIGKNSLPIEIS